MNKRLIRTIVATLFAAVFAPCLLSAQDNVPSETTDSLATVVDTVSLSPEMLGMRIMNSLPSRAKGDSADVSVYQSKAFESAFTEYIISNQYHKEDGYRVRIFFSNSQTAREDSMSAAERFASKYPGIAVYRSFAQPNFKVTVADFRTRSEAYKLLMAIRGDFPSAFIVKEQVILPY